MKRNNTGSVIVPFIENNIHTTFILDQGDKKYDDVQYATQINEKGQRSTLWERPISRGIPVTISESDKSKMVNERGVYVVRVANTPGDIILGFAESTPKPKSGTRDEVVDIIVEGDIKKFFVQPATEINAGEPVSLNSLGRIEPDENGKYYSLVNMGATDSSEFIDVFIPYSPSVVVEPATEEVTVPPVNEADFNLTINDEGDAPIASTVVSIQSGSETPITATTNVSGVASFNSVPYGTYTVSVTGYTSVTPSTITVSALFSDETIIATSS